MKNDYQPILVIPAVPIKNGLRFLRSDTQLDIENPTADKVWQILANCNGYNSLAQITENTKFDKNLVNDVLRDLETLRVISDSREQFRHFHELSSNPTSYSQNLSKDDVFQWQLSPHKPIKCGDVLRFHANQNSQIMKLQYRRHSVRSFADTKLTRDQIGQLCDLGYNTVRHAVPSGGGLYPLKLFVLVSKDQHELRSGYYEYDSDNNQLVRFGDADQEALNFIFNTSKPIFGSSIQIIIAADISRQPHKYSNFGYRLTLIETGQVAQNISLAAVEMGLASCELGGALDKPLSQELSLDEDVVSLLSIAVGYESRKDIPTDDVFLDKLTKEFLGDSHPVKTVEATAYPESSFFIATATFKEGNNNSDLAGATSTSVDFAKSKAIVEAYERSISHTPRISFIGSANDLHEKWLDPRKIMPMTKDQLARQNLAQFNENLQISWTNGKTLSGSRIFIPTDMVYYGYKSAGNRIAWSNSSGVAAFTDLEGAINKAALELIERDALMRNWLMRKSPEQVSCDSLPIHLQKRMKFWRDNERTMHVLLMPSEYAVVVQVVIVGKQYPCFASGAAAELSFNEAASKAYEEAECGLLGKIYHPADEAIDPRDVRSPLDHGALYASPDYIWNIEWLWSGTIVNKVRPLVQSIDEIKSSLNLVTVDLSDERSSVKVVRVFSEKLLPINFGFGNDYFTNATISGFDPLSQKLPHYFA